MAPASLALCLVTDRALAGDRPLADIVMPAVRGGVTMVQLREKTAPTRRFIEEARSLIALLRPLGIPFVVNDRLDVALAVDADGVHVGQDDMPVDVVRRLLGPDRIVGLSITTMAELRDARDLPADYFGVGPIYPQTTKADAAPALGLAGLADLRRETETPLLAIGGIAAANAAAVRHSGADGLAVVSAIMASPDPEAAARLIRNG